jgi:hypothetical protein
MQSLQYPLLQLQNHEGRIGHLNLSFQADLTSRDKAKAGVLLRIAQDDQAVPGFFASYANGFPDQNGANSLTLKLR